MAPRTSVGAGNQEARGSDHGVREVERRRRPERDAHRAKSNLRAVVRAGSRRSADEGRGHVRARRTPVETVAPKGHDGIPIRDADGAKTAPDRCYAGLRGTRFVASRPEGMQEGVEVRLVSLLGSICFLGSARRERLGGLRFGIRSHEQALGRVVQGRR